MLGVLKGFETAITGVGIVKLSDVAGVSEISMLSTPKKAGRACNQEDAR
jgi:hypothetical protein